jgi:hypothetical protein
MGDPDEPGSGVRFPVSRCTLRTVTIARRIGYSLLPRAGPTRVRVGQGDTQIFNKEAFAVDARGAVGSLPRASSWHRTDFEYNCSQDEYSSNAVERHRAGNSERSTTS